MSTPPGSIDTTVDCPMCSRTVQNVDNLCPHEDPMCWRDCQIYHVGQGRWAS